MSDYILTDNDQAEIAVVVDLDTLRVLPLIGAGANRRDMLTSFVESVPFDLSILDDEQLQQAFVAFLGTLGLLSTDAASPDAVDQVELRERPGGDADAARAEAEASAASDVPGPAPSDADMEADAGTQTVVVRCFNCEGAGSISFGDGSPDQKCNTCGGTGKLTMPSAQ